MLRVARDGTRSGWTCTLSSVRLAAVRADELLDERTLPYDHEAVERALRAWPGVRVLL